LSIGASSIIEACESVSSSLFLAGVAAEVPVDGEELDAPVACGGFESFEE
jgi:hypothetical protein